MCSTSCLFMALALSISQVEAPAKAEPLFVAEALPLQTADLADALGVIWMHRKIKYSEPSTVLLWLVEWKKSANGEWRRTALDGGVAIGAAYDQKGPQELEVSATIAERRGIPLYILRQGTRRDAISTSKEEVKKLIFANYTVKPLSDEIFRNCIVLSGQPGPNEKQNITDYRGDWIGILGLEVTIKKNSQR